MDKLTLFSLLLLPAMVVGQQCSIGGECLGTNLDTEFHDTERQCLEYCKTVDGCEWYTYDSSISYCSVLADCSERNLACTTCVHGENECEIRLCFVPGECSGSLLGHVPFPTKEECLLACFDNPECHYFTFYEERGVCNLFETCMVVEDPNMDAVSGERDCYQGAGNTKIFLQDGRNTAWMHMPSVHESGDGTACSQPTDYPMSLGSTAGEIVNGAITLCGGQSGTAFNACFGLDQTLNIWVEFPSMNVARYDAASVLTPGGWWVTGGYGTSYLSTTSLWNGTAWSFGSHLPIEREEHCMVQINSTHTFLAGGYNPSVLSDAYLFDWTRELWTELPEMPAGRAALACTLYRDSQGGMNILAAGGYPNQNFVWSLDLSSPTRWKALLNLPTSAQYAKFVQDGEDLILVNPGYRNMMRFDAASLEFSVISGQTFPLGSADSFVVAVSDASLNGCA